ncbi:unnamed protein product [Calypogeia fissa]
MMSSQMETGSAGKEDSKRLVKVTVFIKKKPGITDEEFHRHWSENHGPLVRSMPIVKEKVLKYTQYHVNTALSSHAATLGLPMMDFDGAAEFVVPDLETLMSVWYDPEFDKTVTPDEQKFMTREGVKIMIGYEDPMIDRT